MPEIAVVVSPALSGIPLTVHDKAFIQPVRDERTAELEATVASLAAIVGQFVAAQTAVPEPVVDTVKEVVKPTAPKPKATEAKVEGTE